jgi:hypothetical protein
MGVFSGVFAELPLDDPEFEETVGGATDGVLRFLVPRRGASGNGVVPVRDKIPCITASWYVGGGVGDGIVVDVQR